MNSSAANTDRKSKVQSLKSKAPTPPHTAMRFYARKRRQAPAVIIVALIDILIVLLIFLMVTTTFKQQPALKLALPESSQAKKTGANEAPPLVVSIDPKGNLRLGADATPVTIERLKEKILDAVAKKPDLQLAISADKAAPFGQVIKVMDVAKEAKLKTGVNLFTKASRQILSLAPPPVPGGLPPRAPRPARPWVLAALAQPGPPFATRLDTKRFSVTMPEDSPWPLSGQTVTAPYPNRILSVSSP